MCISGSLLVSTSHWHCGTGTFFGQFGDRLCEIFLVEIQKFLNFHFLIGKIADSLCKVSDFSVEKLTAGLKSVCVMISTWTLFKNWTIARECTGCENADCSTDIVRDSNKTADRKFGCRNRPCSLAFERNRWTRYDVLCTIRKVDSLKAGLQNKITHDFWYFYSFPNTHTPSP